LGAITTLLQRLVDAAAGGGAARLDAHPLLVGDVAELEQAVDEKPQPGIRRQPASRGVAGIEQACILQVGHDVADRGRRQRLGQPPRQRPRTHRLAGLDIAFDHQAQDLARTVVQDRDRGGRSPQTGTGVGQDAAQRTNPLNCHVKM
jgi:hypothetical protein